VDAQAQGTAAAAKEQFKRFIETVREREADETGKEFERAFKAVVSPKQGQQGRKREGK
jgi:hypothetical protein